MEPGPTDDSILYMQNRHRSGSAYEGDLSVIHIRRCEVLQRDGAHVDERLIPYLEQSGFYTFRQLGFMQVDWSLITALVERWRQKTHTFHLPVGECSITLQDVEVLSGLPVDGLPVTCSTKTRNWSELCGRLLGKVPPTVSLKGARVKIK